MTDLELKKLKDDLWHSADILRSGAHIAANKYGQPILGLIFLRYADILFKQHKKEIDAEFEAKKGGRAERSYKEICIEKCGFYLPECAYFDYLNNLPETAEKATAIKKAMEAIEEENPKLKGVLPKEVYGQLVPEEEPELLSRVVRIFKDIPENIEIDLFGEIYEFFLGEFAIAEGRDGGTFYTPSSVVRYMVEVIKPEAGEKMFLDPACGSGGMFVQAARYMHRHNKSADRMQFRCYGVEKEPDTVKLAKMNLMLNNVRGEITEANSFYSDPYNAFNKFDYVMANPPFNVDEVLYEKVKDATRFNVYGIPRGKTKIGKTDGKETVPNANYLWINYFASALNDKGRAGFVMANNSCDTTGGEAEIRRRIIESGIVKQMVVLPSNMFTSVTLPATLWFFDKDKPEKQKNSILFINAKNIYTQIDRAHRKFSDEQIKNLITVTRLYDGDSEYYFTLLNEYKELANNPTNSSYYKEQIEWLTSNFPNGKYRDVLGLCKVVDIYGDDGIKKNGWSLNASFYAGVVDKPFKSDDVFDGYAKYKDFLDNNLANLNKLLEFSKDSLETLANKPFNQPEESELIARGWKKVSLFDIADLTYGFPFDSSKFTEEKNDVPVLRIRDILNNKVETFTDERPGEKYLIKQGDLLVGMDGIFHTSIWLGNDVYLNQRVVRIRSKYKGLCNAYIYFSIYEKIKSLEKTINGTTVAHLGDKHLKKINVFLPPEDLFKQVMGIFDNWYKSKQLSFLLERHLDENLGFILQAIAENKTLL